MRLAGALAVVVTLSACDDPFPARNPAPRPPPPVQVVVPRVEPEEVAHELVPEAPVRQLPPELLIEPKRRKKLPPQWKPWSADPEPDAAELQGGFELSADTTHPFSGVEGFISVRGDANGATVTSGETCEHCPDFTLDPFVRGSLSKAQAGKLIAELKRLKFWSLNDGVRNVANRGDRPMQARLGKIGHHFGVVDGCPRDVVECPQEELLALLTGARDHAAPAKAQAVNALTFPTVSARKVVQVKGDCFGNPKSGYRCSFDPPGDVMVDQEAVALPWCRMIGPNVFSCFKSPFDTTRYVLTTIDDITVSNEVEPTPAAATLRSGDHCLVDDSGGWSCDQGTELEQVKKFGTTWVALGPDGRDLDLLALYLH